MTATVKPNFAVAADESTYRRLGAVIREKVYRYGESCYKFGLDVQNGQYADPHLQRLALTEQRNRIFGDIEALLMTMDMIVDIKDLVIGEDLKPRKRNRVGRPTKALPADLEDQEDPDHDPQSLPFAAARTGA